MVREDEQDAMTDDTPPSPTRRALLAGAASLAAMSSARAKETAGPKHVVLLGDSIFDNKAYVGDGPDVIAEVQAALPQGWAASLLAVDGSTSVDVKRQLKDLPEGAKAGEPCPSTLSKAHGQYRFQILMRSEKIRTLVAHLQRVL